jgi:hypothetical protein
LATGHKLPWYLMQQIGLFMAIHNAPISESYFDSYDIELHKVLHRILAGEIIGSQQQVLPMVYVAWQLADNKAKNNIMASLIRWIDENRSSKKKQYSVFNSIAINNQKLFIALLHKINDERLPYLDAILKIRANFGIYITKNDLEPCNWPKKMDLSKIILSHHNPFIHENALLKLAKSLLTQSQEMLNGHFSPHEFEVICKDWNEIHNPLEGELLIKRKFKYNKGCDSRYFSPSWLNYRIKDSCKLYSLGCLLRASAIGKIDYTEAYVLKDVNNKGYHGLKAGWFRRRLGMMHSPEALAGYSAPMSSWVSELLFQLLQWPGIVAVTEVELWPKNLSIDKLLNIVTKRLASQSYLFGYASNLPIYVQKINWKLRSENELRVVIIQNLLPKKSSFDIYECTLDDPAFRVKHRQHIAGLCNLIISQLKIVSNVASDPESDHVADLIIFPEVSVHIDDIDLLKELSDKTKAMIYAGICFHKQNDDEVVNKAIWLIPNRTKDGRKWIIRWQGKKYLTDAEKNLKITSWRPYQLLIELNYNNKLSKNFKIAGTICYDATNVDLISDLRKKSNLFLIAGLNHDINRFDSMLKEYNYSMYQPVILANSGEFGGSGATIPYYEEHKRTFTQSHGNNQIAISIFNIDIDWIKNSETKNKVKTPPAGYLEEDFQE